MSEKIKPREKPHYVNNRQFSYAVVDYVTEAQEAKKKGEKNPVVTARANKLKIPVLQGIGNKTECLKELIDREKFDLKNILYVGNDLNDLNAMKVCGFTACPADSHEMIKSIATIVLKTKGGGGIVRELLETVFQVNFIKILNL